MTNLKYLNNPVQRQEKTDQGAWYIMICLLLTAWRRKSTSSSTYHSPSPGGGTQVIGQRAGGDPDPHQITVKAVPEGHEAAKIKSILKEEFQDSPPNLPDGSQNIQLIVGKIIGQGERIPGRHYEDVSSETESRLDGDWRRATNTLKTGENRT